MAESVGIVMGYAACDSVSKYVSTDSFFSPVAFLKKNPALLFPNVQNLSGLILVNINLMFFINIYKTQQTQHQSVACVHSCFQQTKLPGSVLYWAIHYNQRIP